MTHLYLLAVYKHCAPFARRPAVLRFRMSDPKSNFKIVQLMPYLQVLKTFDKTVEVCVQMCLLFLSER